MHQLIEPERIPIKVEDAPRLMQNANENDEGEEDYEESALSHVSIITDGTKNPHRGEELSWVIVVYLVRKLGGFPAERTKALSQLRDPLVLVS